MDNTYAEVGTEVILGRHTKITTSGLRWCSDCMNPLVGRKVTITQVFIDRDGLLMCYVEPGNHHAWRVEDMILASDVPLLTPEQKRQRNIR